MSSIPNSPSQPAPPPGSDPIARLLHFETSVANLRAGLVDLEATPSYLMLSGNGSAGKTRHILGPAAAKATALWPLLLAVGQRLDEARTQAGEKSAFGSRKDAELAALLDLPIGPLAATDLEGRSLSLAEAVNEIRSRYGAIRDGASEIEALWLGVLPRIDSAVATLNALAVDAQELGITEPLLGRARALVEDLNERLVTDPLSVHIADGENLDALVAKASGQIARLQTGREDLAEDLAHAKQLLGSLRTARSQAGANRIESEAKVLNPVGLVQVPSEAVFDHPEKGLDNQLRKVVSADDWSSQRALLDLWLGSARRLSVQLQKVEAKNAAPLSERSALRGRLRAYQAKMAAIGMAEDMDLTGVVDAATDELFTVPTDLTRASRLIADLAERLRQRG